MNDLDELVRELRDDAKVHRFHGREFHAETCDAGAAAIVAQQRYIDDMHDTLDKIAAAIGVQGRDADKLLARVHRLKALAEAMHDRLCNERGYPLGECLDYRNDFPKDAP